MPAEQQAFRATQAPFPYFGGKAKVAARVWAALGDCGHYLEPFFGSGAVLLARPHWEPTKTETVCDADGHLANVWRGLQFAPDEVARWCDWPVNHCDLTARKRVLNAATQELADRLFASDTYFDARLAGYWIWAASCWIGHGLIYPGKIPHLANAGKGVHKKSKIPHLADAGKGVQEPYNLNIYRWLRQLSERLRHVRVVCGDWSRICGGDWQDCTWSTVGMFFDPPYGTAAKRDSRLYAVDSLEVAGKVHAWCLERGGRENYRIILAGYYEEHVNLLNHGWTVERWKARGGYANIGNGQGKINRHREALFFSPHCFGTRKSTCESTDVLF